MMKLSSTECALGKSSQHTWFKLPQLVEELQEFNSTLSTLPLLFPPLGVPRLKKDSRMGVFRACVQSRNTSCINLFVSAVVSRATRLKRSNLAYMLRACFDIVIFATLFRDPCRMGMMLYTRIRAAR